MKIYHIHAPNHSNRLETIDGTAEAEKDYIPLKAELVFGPNETEKSIDVIVIDDDEWEPDEVTNLSFWIHYKRFGFNIVSTYYDHSHVIISITALF